MWQLWFLLCFAVFCAIVSFFYPYKPMDLKKKEEAAKHLWLIYILRCMHYFTLTFSILYPLLFPPAYDILYIAIALLAWLHWELLRNECILTLWEKQLLDPSYKIGDDAYTHPFMNVFFSRPQTRFIFHLTFLAFFIVLTRFLWTNRYMITKAINRTIHQK